VSCFLSALLHAKRVRRGTRVLGTSKQAVLVLRWFLDDARMCGLPGTTPSGCPRPMPTARRGSRCWPPLHGALLAAKAAGYSYVIVDGTLIYTDPIAAPGPTPGVDLWWLGKQQRR